MISVTAALYLSFIQAITLLQEETLSAHGRLVTLTGNNRIRYNGAHGIMIGNGDQVSVKVAGNAEIVMELCAYTADGVC